MSYISQASCELVAQICQCHVASEEHYLSHEYLVLRFKPQTKRAI